jgi:hypothetical protein
MKTSTSILALMGLFTVAFGVAIPDDNAAVANIKDTSDDVRLSSSLRSFLELS